MLSGIHGYQPAAHWARRLSKRQRRRLGFRNGDTPAASTLYEVLRVLPWEALETELRRWMAGAELEPHTAANGGPAGARWAADAVAQDGKTARGSWERGAGVAHMLAVVSHQRGLTYAQDPVTCKQGELTAVRPWLKQLVLRGLVLTVDAQFTQRDLAERLGDAEADYVMRVKENQPTLLAQARSVLSQAGYDPERRRSSVTVDVGHGRIEERQLEVQHLRPGEVEWPGAQQVFVVISQRLTKAGTTPETIRHDGITSLGPEEAGPERLARLFRGHWAVENKAFWVRDVVFGEDASPVSTGNIVAVLASLRGAVANLARATGGDRVKATILGFNADRPAALRALGCP
jgi:predicted transposase YbfD/YdcC